MKDAYKVARMKQQAGLGELSELYEVELAAAKRILFEETIPLALDINDEIKSQAAGRKRSNVGYMVTVRPKCAWNTFYDKVCEYVKRKPFENWELVFEQKGPILGEGFHFHMILTKWGPNLKSKADLLLWTQSSFKDLCAPNCVKVDAIHNDADLITVRSYIYEHKSQDGHKESTRDSDAEWRTSLGLKSKYDHTNGLSSTSAIVPSHIVVF